MKKTVILGAGQAGRAVLALLNGEAFEAVAFGDNNPLLDCICGVPVLPVWEVLALNPDLVIISVLGEDRRRQLRQQARELGYSGDIIEFSELNALFDIRSATLMRIAERITEVGVPGCVAELGVYRGALARRLNALFPERRLYLFDTFEGFDVRDIDAERREGASKAKARDFSNTCVEEVLARLPYAEQAVIKKGFFPETTDGIEETFALVSIDADLYAPTLSGLRYFYPRLSPGGIIVLHDYSSGRFGGVKKAVRAYERSDGFLPLVPLCDVHGTAIIIK